MSDTKPRFAKLTNDNYYAWSFRMELKLRKHGVWSIVSGTESRPQGSDNTKAVKAWQTRRDLALNEIVAEVEDGQLVHVRVSAEDPELVWNKLKEVHQSQGLGSIISMWQKFFQLKKADNVSVQAHAGSIQELADRLTGLGDPPSESLMVAVLILSLPDSFSSIVTTLDAHADGRDFAFVVQRCMNEEAHQLARKLPAQGTSKNSHVDAFHASDTKTRRDKKDITCYRCQKKGHYRNECTEKENSKETAATAEVAASGLVDDEFDEEW